MTIFKSVIKSNFKYCPAAWHFCTQSSTNQMEKIQKRALRFICDDSESPLLDLLRLNNASFLHISRIKLMVREVVKIVHVKISNYNFRREKQAN